MAFLRATTSMFCPSFDSWVISITLSELYPLPPPSCAGGHVRVTAKSRLLHFTSYHLSYSDTLFLALLFICHIIFLLLFWFHFYFSCDCVVCYCTIINFSHINTFFILEFDFVFIFILFYFNFLLIPSHPSYIPSSFTPLLHSHQQCTIIQFHSFNNYQSCEIL